MKLRVRINRQTSRVELPGDDPRLRDLMDHVQEAMLSTAGFSPETPFSLSLNGSEPLSDSGQTLSSCGVVPGDLVCVVLPETEAPGPEQPASSSEERRGETPTGTEKETQLAAPASSTEDTAPSAPSWDPLLVSEAGEGHAPLTLELLHQDAQSGCPSDALMVVGHLLMLETGFTPQDTELKAGHMPAGWRSAGGVYKLPYLHPQCEGSSAMLLALRMGPLVVINATLKVDGNVDAVRKLSLDPSSYVTEEWSGGSAAAAFKDLSKLSRVFKDQLAYPLIAAAREALSLPMTFGLSALPPELLLRILRLLDLASLLRLSTVSRHFHTVASDSALWRHLVRRDFNDSDSRRPTDTDWKELYKRFYQTSVERRQVTRPYIFPHFHPNPPFRPRPPPTFPPVPGIIGGEYDQRPNLPYGALPRPRYDPIGPLPPPHQRPAFGRPSGSRSADARRGFI